MSTKSPVPANPDFSLVLGGPLFQLFRRAHLAGDGLEMLWRRLIVLAGMAWVPLFLLSLASGQAFGDAVRIPFLMDVEAHVRFLVALPLLVAAELVVHRRLMPSAPFGQRARVRLKQMSNCGTCSTFHAASAPLSRRRDQRWTGSNG